MHKYTHTRVVDFPLLNTTTERQRAQTSQQTYRSTDERRMLCVVELNEHRVELSMLQCFMWRCFGVCTCEHTDVFDDVIDFLVFVIFFRCCLLADVVDGIRCCCFFLVMVLLLSMCEYVYTFHSFVCFWSYCLDVVWLHINWWWWLIFYFVDFLKNYLKII